MFVRYFISNLGACISLLVLFAVTQSAQAQTYSILYSFTGGADGGTSIGGLTKDAAGNLYGTTGFGGGGTCSLGCGTVFKIDASGAKTILYSFTGLADGATPYATLIRDSTGDLYGTTQFGGVYNYGTVFAVNSMTGRFKSLHSFNGADGRYPIAGVVQDSNGILYGVTVLGGNLAECSGNGCGTVFKLDPSGTLTVMRSFTAVDGANPFASLIQDSNGILYGTTVWGGNLAECSGNGCGTVFQLDPSGTLTVLHSFSRFDGVNPSAGLIRDTAGNLYGTTLYGGDDNAGVVFQLDPTGTLTVLHSFNYGDGSYVFGGLIQDTNGFLYGNAAGGGRYGYGTVFKLDPATGRFRVLHIFAGGTDGATPQARLVSDGSGNLVGTTVNGGPDDFGTVFRISPR